MTTTSEPRPRLNMALTLSGDPEAPLPTRAQLLAARDAGRKPVKASTDAGDAAAADDDQGDDDADDAADDSTPRVEAARSVTPARAGRNARATRPELNPFAAIKLMLAAQKGDAGAARELQAAAGDHDVTKLAGLVPPQYATRIIGDVPARRRIFDNAVAHRTLWSTGMTLNVPNLTDDVAGGWIAADGGAIPTDDMTIGFSPVPVKLWGHSAKASYSLIERSDPSYIEAYYRRAISSFYRDVEVDLGALILTSAKAATGVDAATPTVKDLFTMAAEVLDNSHASATSFEAEADVALCSPLVWADLMSTAEATAPAFSGGAGGAAPGVGNIAGVKIVAVPTMTEGTILVGDSTAVSAYGGQSEAMRLAALVVGVSQWQHGVLAEFARASENPNGWVSHVYTSPLYKAAEQRKTEQRKAEAAKK